MRIVEPFYGRWSAYKGMAPKNDYEDLSVNDLQVELSLDGTQADVTWKVSADEEPDVVSRTM